MPYRSTKTYGHDVGLSCAFRQWKATHSHCSKVHGYALGIRIEFESETLDDRNWVVDYGGMKDLKKELESWFDHTTVISADDPAIDEFKALHRKGIIDLRVLSGVGCEMFAEHVYDLAVSWLSKQKIQHGVRVALVEVKEHGANSAIYIPE